MTEYGVLAVVLLVALTGILFTVGEITGYAVPFKGQETTQPPQVSIIPTGLQATTMPVGHRVAPDTATGIPAPPPIAAPSPSRVAPDTASGTGGPVPAAPLPPSPLPKPRKRKPVECRVPWAYISIYASGQEIYVDGNYIGMNSINVPVQPYMVHTYQTRDPSSGRWGPLHQHHMAGPCSLWKVS